MGKFLRGSGGVLFVVVGLVGALNASPFAAAAEPVEKNYKKLCRPCHGDDGSGKGAAAGVLDKHPGDFTDCVAMKALTHDFLVKIISEGGAGVGRSSQMPASAKKLSTEEIGELATYISTHFCKDR